MNDMDLFAKLSASAQDAVARQTKQSAVHVILWLSAIVIPTCIFGAIKTDGDIRTVLLVFAGLPIVLFAGAYIFFMLKNPDRLQSEGFQLRKQALELIEEKGGRIPMAETSVEAISNPDMPLIEGSASSTRRLEK